MEKHTAGLSSVGNVNMKAVFKTPASASASEFYTYGLAVWCVVCWYVECGMWNVESKKKKHATCKFQIATGTALSGFTAASRVVVRVAIVIC